MIKASKVYDKYIKGDNLSDAEIAAGIEHFRMLSTLALQAGPVFKLASNEANRVAIALEGFQQARKSR